MELVSRLLEVLFRVQELEIPCRRLKRWSAGTFALCALLFPTAFRAALIQFSEARVCSIESTFSNAFTMESGSFQVVKHAGGCQLRFVNYKATP